MTSDPPATQPRWAALIMVLGILSPLVLGFRSLGWGPSTTTVKWVFPLEERIYARAQAIHQPKVLFIGGSNVLFGINTPSLQARIGQPVVNYGLHAGLGIDLIAERAATLIRPGDRVVYLPEFGHFVEDGHRSDNDDLRRDWIVHYGSAVDHSLDHPPLRQFLLARSWAYELIDQSKFQWLLLVQEALRRASSQSGTGTGNPAPKMAGPYNLGAYDEHGYLMLPRPALAGPLSKIRFAPQPQHPWEMEMLNSRAGRGFALLRDVCQRVGADLYVMPPIRIANPVAPQAFDQLEERWLQFAVQHHAQILLGPKETTFDLSLGYDTEYHLNDQGVAVLEDRLVRALLSPRATPDTR